jgi:hypothetical protein
MECWEITDTTIMYRGVKRDLPEFLPGFTMPVSRAWFDVLFRKYRQKKAVVYRADAYMVTTGDIIYDCRAAHTAEIWADAMKGISFAVQVDWVETPRRKRGRSSGKRDRSAAAMQVSILRPDWCRRALEKQRTIGTTQGRFLAFLRSGRLEDLENPPDNLLDPSPATSWKKSYANEPIQAT